MKDLNKAILGLVLLVSLLIMGCFQYFGENASELTLMTFNVRHRDEQVDKYAWDVRSTEIIDTVLEHLPDILAVQELNDRTGFGSEPAHDSVQSLLLTGLRDYFKVYVNSRDPSLYRSDCLVEDVDIPLNLKVEVS